MTHASRRLVSGFSLVMLLGGALTASQSGQSVGEETYRRVFDHAQELASQGKFDQAVSDYTDVANRAVGTRLAGQALLEVIRLQLEARHDLPKASENLKRLLDNPDRYPRAEAEALVLRGRIQMAGETVNIAAALDDFDRVPSRSPDPETLQMAGYFAVRALRISKKPEDALRRFRSLAAEYPAQVWTARARLEAARCLVDLGRPIDALAELRWIGDHTDAYSGDVLAELQQTVLAWSTLLYRLHVRVPAQPLYGGFQPMPMVGAVKNVLGMVIDADETVHIAMGDRILSLDVSGKPVTRFPRINDLSAIGIDEKGAAFVGMRGAVASLGQDAVSLSIPRPNETPRRVERIEALARFSNGQFIVSSEESESLQRFSGAEYKGVFASGRMDRLAVNSLDDVAGLRQKSITVFDRSGATLGRIDPVGQGYELRKPSDIAYDALGYLYVLDRTANALYVFNPRRQLVTGFNGSSKQPGSFKEATALGLDRFGRMYVADDNTGKIIVYR